MKIIVSPYRSASRNIASEEYLAGTCREAVFYLYVNRPSVIVGCNQNTYAEINHRFVQEQNIRVVRRLSGGGAVYHDSGNLNFGFIFKDTGEDVDRVFRDFTAPVLEVLSDLGVSARFSGRNDLTINGAKFSGSAQWRSFGKILIHGTLLFNSDLTVLSRALQASPLKFRDKGVKSVRSRVTNILPHLPEPIKMNAFRDAVVRKVGTMFPDCRRYAYSPADRAAIETLARNKYAKREWNYGKSPSFSYRHGFRYEKGTLEICVNAEAGRIREVKFYGDFFGREPDIAPLEQAFSGAEYSSRGIEQVLRSVKVSDYIDGLSDHRFISGFFAESSDPPDTLEIKDFE